MRIYLEASEIVDMFSGIVPEFIRADVTGKTDTEIADIQADIEAIMAGKAYRLTKHYCQHESDPELSCNTELIREVIL